MLSSHSWNLPSSTTFPFNLWSHWWLLTSTSFLPLKLQSCLPLLHTSACPHGTWVSLLGPLFRSFLCWFLVDLQCLHLCRLLPSSMTYTPNSVVYTNLCLSPTVYLSIHHTLASAGSLAVSSKRQTSEVTDTGPCSPVGLSVSLCWVHESFSETWRTKLTRHRLTAALYCLAAGF